VTMEEAKAAGEKLQEIATTLGKNYGAALVTQALIPAINNGLNELVEEAKEALGKAEKKEEDLLPEDPKEKEADTFLIDVDSADPIHTRYDTKFMAYTTFIIRIGNKEQKEEKKFYVNAQRYRLQYGSLSRMTEKARKDLAEMKKADVKIPDFPAKYEFGGSYCICLTKAPGDKPAHQKAVKEYCHELFNKLPGYAPCLADFFKVGNDFEIQQTTYAVFVEAFNNTCSDLGFRSLKRDIQPFTQKEFLIDLLQGVVDRDIWPNVESKLGDSPQLVKNQCRNMVLSAVETAAAPWDTVSDAAQKAGEEVTKKVMEMGQKLVDMLKEPLGKIVALVQEKMKEKEEKGDDGDEEEKGDEKKDVAVGDIAKAWTFLGTEIGKKFDGDLDGKQKPSEAVKGASDAIKKALDDGVRKPMQKFVSGIKLPKGPTPFVLWKVKQIITKITNLIMELTSLDGFLEASGVMAGVIDSAEEQLGKCDNKEKTAAAIDAISKDLWQKGTAKVAMALWIKIYKSTDKIQSIMSDQPEDAVAPLTDLLAHFFEVQLRAFNGIRIQYVRNLRDSIDDIKDAESAVRVSRAAFKGAVIPVVNLLAFHHWIRAFEAFQESSKVIVKAAFEENVWPSIKAGLDAIQSCIPDELTQMGLKLEPLVRAVINFILDKAIVWIMTKVFLTIERALFTQGGEGGGY
jgi:hypothetical protein